MVRVLGVSRAGYYAWAKRPPWASALVNAPLNMIEAIGALGSHSQLGLEACECRWLQRLAGIAGDLAGRVEAMWERAFDASGGRKL